MSNKAILVVSFGTSIKETREKTIDKIEDDIKAHFSDYKIYRAFTSKIIINKLKNRDNYKVDTVKEALNRMINDGIEDLIVQPTHIINGTENDIMTEEIKEYKDKFKSIKIGSPLLTTTEDFFDVTKILINEFSYISKNDSLIFMGHGTSHYSNSCYPALDYIFKSQGYNNIHIGTVEGYPTLDDAIHSLKNDNPNKVYLSPLMIVAGDHALNDMSGSENTSWENILKSKKYNVQCILKGLGEYSSIRNLFIKHINSASEIA